MFYSQFILAKKGPLGTIWIAAHLERKLRKNQVADTDIGVSVDSILFPEVPIALRLSSHLLLGVVRIYSRKVNYLFDDCSEALLKIKQAFRSTAVDLPPEESTAPYHSITLPETFDLDDFELPDNDFFQGNYVDHHISTREQITLQDTMDGVVYSTSQFGLDERFGDGDASQIGLDLDEELLLDKVTAADNGESVANAQGSAKPMAPWEQDNISEQINETSEVATVNDRADQLERLGLNAEVIEYAEAPSTPGLVQEPNLSSVQKALAGDDHVESECHNSNEFMSTESGVKVLKNLDLCHRDSHVMKWPLQCMLLEENGHHARDAEVKQAESLGVTVKSLPLVSDGSKEAIDELDGSNRLVNMQIAPSMPSAECLGVESDVQDSSHETYKASTHVPVSEASLVDNKVSMKTNIHVDAEVTENTTVSCLPVVVDHEVHADQEPEDPKTLENHIVYKDMPSVGMNVLKPCSSHLSPPHMSSHGHDNSMAPNLQSVEVEQHSSGISKRNEASVEVQGEECCVAEMAQSGSVCGDIQADNGKLDGPLANASSSDNQLKEVNNFVCSDLPAPEMLLSVPEGVLDKPNDLLVESTPEREALAGSGATDAGKLISGKKRSYTESTVTVESLNSSESFGVDRSKRNSEFIPDDDDLLSSILVGRKSSVLKMKPTPPAPEIASRKRARSVAQTNALKRKVLMDDMMVLHGDIIRQQLTNTEDIRRVRKKAPCTCPEILMIQIQFLEDEIFNEPIFTGMSAELTSLQCEKHDLSKIRVLETDERHESSKVAKDVECSVSPYVHENGREGSQEIFILKNSCEAQPGESAMQTEIQQGSHQHIGYHNIEAQEHTNSVTDILELKTVHNESLMEVTEMIIDRGNVEVADKANCSLVHGIETLSQADVASVEICNLPAEDRTNGADAYLQMDASCLTPAQKVDTHPVEENASLENISKTKVVEDAENIEDIVMVQNEAKGRDKDWLDEGKVGPSVENGADVQTDCMKLTGNANIHEVASLETGRYSNLASANIDNSELGIMNDDGIIVQELGTSNHSFGEETAIDSTTSVKLDGDGENATLDDVKNQVDLLDHPVMEDCREFEEAIVGNDTEFLNVDDDEVAEDYEVGNGCAEETRLLENSGWSSRTRAVAKYLQALCVQETVHGRKVLSLDHLLAGKTRKEASRMFFETLVLKTKDYIHVEQVKPLDNIHIKPRGKLMKSDF